MPSEGPSRPYNRRPKSLAKLKWYKKPTFKIIYNP